MSSWASTVLSGESWEPSRYLASVDVAAPPGYEGPVARLGNLVALIPSGDRASSRQAAVVPSGIDRETGAVVTAGPGRDQRVCSLDNELVDGDVLVPASGSGPCVLVGREHTEFKFAHFFPLRPASIEGVLLWGLLSSATGVGLRRQLAGGSIGPRIRSSSLLGLQIPMLPAQATATIASLLPDPPVRLESPLVRSSEWSLTDLSEAIDWHRPIALLGVEELGEHRLEDVAQVASGRVSQKDLLDVPIADALPVADSRWVRKGGVPGAWAPFEQHQRSLVGPGSVVVAATGVLRARVVREPMLLSRTVFGLQVGLGVPDRVPLGGRLATYLNSDAGQLIFRQFAAGASIPRLTRRQLMELPVPSADALSPSIENESPEAVLLADRLEEALWPR